MLICLLLLYVAGIAWILRPGPFTDEELKIIQKSVDFNVGLCWTKRLVLNDKIVKYLKG